MFNVVPPRYCYSHTVVTVSECYAFHVLYGSLIDYSSLFCSKTIYLGGIYFVHCSENNTTDCVANGGRGDTN